jgi:hypothetical protein
MVKSMKAEELAVFPKVVLVTSADNPVVVLADTSPGS